MPDETIYVEKLRIGLIRHGVTHLGANQFLQQQMVTDANDRSHILQLVIMLAKDPNWTPRGKMQGNPRHPTAR